ncbi:uncharacterized protein PHACADRAFT_260271 [Phanerochaete carnosa HHB-10118-sp]|uniref:Uncharacterized protein n=1 Tax=Phanerochaete carnosa (strain HHB-10118-sp) TaxID=650164 RepID=K5VQM9_PHACS|nr:uncharacterized protein PHACADRAFT_260271 [Phanerochaete carnosa HHB-10118-sp]EKM53773.1 hypothetical protein PHACADRAFT_260271 [Phanerochaete carnosa HHB-10118-sp]
MDGTIDVRRTPAESAALAPVKLESTDSEPPFSEISSLTTSHGSSPSGPSPLAGSPYPVHATTCPDAPPSVCEHVGAQTFEGAALPVWDTHASPDSTSSAALVQRVASLEAIIARLCTLLERRDEGVGTGI